MRRFTPLVISLCVEAISAQAEEMQDYFPQQEANTWTYLHRAKFLCPRDSGFAYDGWAGRDIPLADYLRAEYVTATMTHWEEIDGEEYGFPWDIFSDGKPFRKSEEGDVSEYRSWGENG